MGIEVKVTDSELDTNSIIKSVGNVECGAVSVFIGTTREHFNGRRVKTLYYEAYETMALKQMRSISIAATKNWPEVMNIVIHHRLGEVKVGEVGLVIAVSSPHRQQAQEVVTYLLDQVKTSVPIFKKELYIDGSGQWKANVECTWKEKY
ncbi:molybdopterin synthase catalytic subunit [Adelges cooleyi]|uniref:molybdopterin synthase catalytic subunit n=1 Tax=Adelges cooleyi TaxID=133065 RepID=UPI00217F3D2C|nr:molybdopterin synthase catalytic subunit [Adelges cooleyi]